MRRRLSVFVVFCLLALLFSCRRERGERQLLDDVEQTWQLCETSVAEAVARADALEDTVRKASELLRAVTGRAEAREIFRKAGMKNGEKHTISREIT